jgi:Ala-tRNA(Pro) deacylase
VGIAITLERYLEDRRAEYDALPHKRTYASRETAAECHVPNERLAKGVVLRAGAEYLLAVLPASHHIRLAELREALGRPVRLASEEELRQMFADCDWGAIPALGEAYGLETIVDDSLADQPHVFFEGGDHATLVHVDGDTFQGLLLGTSHGRFSAHD